MWLWLSSSCVWVWPPWPWWCVGARLRRARRTRLAPARVTRIPLATPSQAITEGAAAEPAVTRRPRAITPRVWVTVTEAAMGRTSFIRAWPPRAAAVAAMMVLPWPGGKRVHRAEDDGDEQGQRGEARGEVVPGDQVVQGPRPAVGAARQHGGGGLDSSSARAAPPGRTRRAAVAVSAGRRATPRGSG
ncbi:hypothetical protein SCYAM73S_03327 [Streptomyces cyaneofuscatus]